MNPAYIINSLNENTLNKFSYRPFAKKTESYLDFKTTKNAKNGIKYLNHII